MSEQTGSWQPDPFGRHQYRYWDGAEWTDQVADDGVTSVDPPVADPAGAVTGEGESAAGEGAAPEAAAPAEPPPPAEAAAPVAPAAAVPPSDPQPSTPPAEPQGWGAPDATTAMAATPPPAAPGAGAGAPGGPSEPAPPAASGGGGGSNLPGIIVGVVILLALIGAAVWFFVLRDDDSDAHATVVSFLEEDLDLTSSQANCVADELGERVDLGEVASAMKADREPTDAQAAALVQALLECNAGFGDIDDGVDDGDDADSDDTTTTTEDDTTDTTEDASGPGSSIPSSLLDAVAQGIMQESDLSQEQARCFAEELFSMDGFDFDQAMTDPEAFADQMAQPDSETIMAFFEVFDRCGIDPLEMGGGLPGGGGGTSGGLLEGQSYGDNPVLDALWDRCEDGDGEACDELYFSSQVDSAYEEFGDTCGGRVEAGTVLCAFEDLN